MQKSNSVIVGSFIALAVTVTAGCSVDGAAFSKVDPIPADKGVVYIYRPDHLAGSAVYGTLSADNAPVTKIKNGGYYPYIANPGTVHFAVTTEATNTADVTVEAGKETYVKSSVGMGFLVGHLTLDQVSPDIGQQEIQSCKLLPPISP